MQETPDYATSWQVQENSQDMRPSDSKSKIPLRTDPRGNVKSDDLAGSKTGTEISAEIRLACTMSSTGITHGFHSELPKPQRRRYFHHCMLGCFTVLPLILHRWKLEGSQDCCSNRRRETISSIATDQNRCSYQCSISSSAKWQENPF